MQGQPGTGGLLPGVSLRGLPLAPGEASLQSPAGPRGCWAGLGPVCTAACVGAGPRPTTPKGCFTNWVLVTVLLGGARFPFLRVLQAHGVRGHAHQSADRG